MNRIHIFIDSELLLGLEVIPVSFPLLLLITEIKQLKKKKALCWLMVSEASVPDPLVCCLGTCGKWGHGHRKLLLLATGSRKWKRKSGAPLSPPGNTQQQPDFLPIDWP